MPYVFRLPALFPWADLSVDEEFYRSKGVGVKNSDAEEGEGREGGDENTADMESVRPWSVEAGEIARFMLRLSLNDLGRSFLTAERFLRRGEFPRQMSVRETKNEIDKAYENGLKYILHKKRFK
jgi:hypothetical protein